MDIMELENALNELIVKAVSCEGYVWIVDKKGNNFAIRLNAPVKLRAYPVAIMNERKEEKMIITSRQINALAALLEQAEGQVNNDIPTPEEMAIYLLEHGVTINPSNNEREAE